MEGSQSGGRSAGMDPLQAGGRLVGALQDRARVDDVRLDVGPAERRQLEKIVRPIRRELYRLDGTQSDHESRSGNALYQVPRDASVASDKQGDAIAGVLRKDTGTR